MVNYMNQELGYKLLLNRLNASYYSRLKSCYYYVFPSIHFYHFVQEDIRERYQKRFYFHYLRCNFCITDEDFYPLFLVNTDTDDERTPEYLELKKAVIRDAEIPIYTLPRDEVLLFEQGVLLF